MFLKKKLLEAKKKQELCETSSSNRLNRPIVEHCLLCFKPSPDLTTFEGSEIFKLALPPGSTKEITVNAVDLIITKAIWEENLTLNRQEPNEIRFEENNILKLVFEPSLLEQKGQLRLNFKGNITDKKLQGFYIYDSAPHIVEESGDGSGPSTQQKQVMNLMTGFLPCEARRCFPCWDDPIVKMIYDIILVVPKGAVALGPTPEKARYRHKRDATLEVAEFKTTPKMATSCLGFAFGAFEHIEMRTSDDEMVVRVYAPPGKKKDGQFALTLASRAIPFYGEYFGCRLEMQKLDLVAIPNAIGEPSNSFGLIFFRHTDILVEPATALVDLMWVSLILCQQITIQWFGNLVTNEWWSHAWLRDGVASFLKYIFVNFMFPEMEVWTHFVTHIFHKALKMDGLKSSHPVDVPVQTPSEIEDSFGEICMTKAPSLVRMVHRFVGDVAFRKGLELYFNRYKYGNASAADFWKCMQEASSKPVVSMMNSWMTARGYPVLTVTAKHDNKNRYLKLTQERFYYDPSQRDTKGQGQIWNIPLTFSTRNHPNQSVLDVMMDQKTLTVTITDVQKTDWLKINPGSIGFFRVRYPHEMYTQLVFAIREKSMPPLDRLNILDDAFAFLLAGHSNTVEVLSLLEAYIEDDDYAVWMTISNIFDKCLKVFDFVGKSESFQSFGRYIYSTIYSKLGWVGHPDELIQRKLLRTLVLRMMSKFNYPEVVEQSKLLFESHHAGEDSTPIPVDLRYVVYKTAVMYGDESIVKRFIKHYRECESAEEKDKYACAMGATRNPQQIQHVLDFSLSEEVGRGQTILILNSVAKSKVGKELTWTFFKENFSTLRSRYGPIQMSKLIVTILEDFVTEEKITEIQDFFKLSFYPGTERAVQQATESIKINELWLKREKNLTALQDYLESMQ